MPNQFLSPLGDIEDYFITESWLIDQYVGDIVWGMGSNSVGQLGNNTTTTSQTPVTFVTGGNNWKQISSGGNIESNTFTAAVRTGNTLWLWGRNAYGQLGINDTTDRLTPVTTFLGGVNWIQVSCARRHIGAIKNDGTLWMWGKSDDGRLGTNDIIDKSTPVTTFAGGNNWTQVACGSNFTLAIKNDGTLWTWGRNADGQLGINNTTTRSTPVTTFAGGNNWKKVACGYRSSAAIKTDGTLWTWGRNAYGQLATNDGTDRLTPVTTFLGGNNWKKISCKKDSFAAIKVDGSLWLWGANGTGQLGTNDIISKSTPVTTFSGGNNWKEVSCGYDHTAAIKTDGTLWTWGSNLYSQLGRQGGSSVSVPTIVPLSGNMRGNSWKTVASSVANTYAISSGIPVDLS